MPPRSPQEVQDQLSYQHADCDDGNEEYQERASQ
jgi:hypothetical protein